MAVDSICLSCFGTRRNIKSLNIASCSSRNLCESRPSDSSVVASLVAVCRSAASNNPYFRTHGDLSRAVLLLLPCSLGLVFLSPSVVIFRVGDEGKALFCDRSFYCTMVLLLFVHNCEVSSRTVLSFPFVQTDGELCQLRQGTKKENTSFFYFSSK